MAMDRELKSNFALIDKSKSIVELYENEPITHWSEFALKNVTVIFKEDTTIELTGDKIEWSFSFENQSVDDMDNKPDERYVKNGFKDVLDLFTRVRKPYVKAGWCKLEKTTPYHCIMSKWYLVL